MTVVIIFGAALFAIIFFCLGAVFKTLASMFNGIIDACTFTLATAFLAFAALFILSVVYSISHGLLGIEELFGVILSLIIMLGLLGAIVGGLGAFIASILLFVAQMILYITSFLLENAASICESAYRFFLNIIFKRIEKC